MMASTPLADVDAWILTTWVSEIEMMASTPLADVDAGMVTTWI